MESPAKKNAGGLPALLASRGEAKTPPIIETAKSERCILGNEMRIYTELQIWYEHRRRVSMADIYISHTTIQIWKPNG